MEDHLPPAIFISHSSHDQALVQALTDLLRSAFRLSSKDILCTSVSGHKLPAGADTEQQLLETIRDTRLLIGLITPASNDSAYVLFELGARWGLRLPLIPLVALGTKVSDIKEPLRSRNALDASSQDDVLQLVEDVAKILERTAEPVSSFNSKVRGFVTAAKLRSSKTTKHESSLQDEKPHTFIWKNLLEAIEVHSRAKAGGCDTFAHQADKASLNPFKPRYKQAFEDKVTFSGGYLKETRNHESIESPTSNYEFRIAPELFDVTAPVIRQWLETNLPLDTEDSLTLRFLTGITREAADYRIATKIFGSPLAMVSEHEFIFDGKYPFTLDDLSEAGDEVVIYMGLKDAGNFQTIPFAPLLMQLVASEILHLPKAILNSVIPSTRS